MAKIYLSEVNINNPLQAINFIVSNARAEINRRIKSLTGMNVSAYTNAQVSALILAWAKAPYDVSGILNIPYYGQVVYPGDSLYATQLRGGYQGLQGLQRDYLPGEDPGQNGWNEDGSVTGDSNGNTFGDILGSISGFLDSATGLLSLFFHPKENTPPPPPAPPKTFWSDVKDWAVLYPARFYGTIFGIAIFLIAVFNWKSIKKMFAKKA